MKIIHAGKMPWGESLAAHRQGKVAHKLLFESIAFLTGPETALFVISMAMLNP